MKIWDSVDGVGSTRGIMDNTYIGMYDLSLGGYIITGGVIVKTKKKDQYVKPWGLWPVGSAGFPIASKTDPQGSYTGLPDDPYETPVQDADDL